MLTARCLRVVATGSFDLGQRSSRPLKAIFRVSSDVREINRCKPEIS